ncbi:glycosyltransferase family 25 protein [Rodentibacter trehalosifermentans]|uniref:glycosyltransferase family 25 protein n=1 Tax=Rodentibacter trehalosifermentans TaxID=1908263 RepID=UPI00098472E3|nr:glycosyltransferase family 25 protein [Rodentibacter trehalosifermentans]OOF53967.1 lipooligosaccharide biosynthesis protein lpsA [Rodentibacter trehalosifermentans]
MHSTAQHSTAQHSTAQHNYVISLTTAQKRRKHIENEFGKQNISFSFFDAVTPSNIEKIAKKLNITLDRSPEALLSDTEIGCALSHIFLWHFMLENQLDYINIFEDDIHLGENAKELLEIDYLPDDTDVLKLEANGILFGKDGAKKIKCDREIIPLSFKQSGTAGYTLTPKGARYLLGKVQNKPLTLAADNLIFEEFVNQKDYKVMQLIPAICVQDFIINPNPFKSSLAAGRAEVSHNQIKASPLEKIKKEWVRLKRRWFGKPIPFK